MALGLENLRAGLTRVRTQVFLSGIHPTPLLDFASFGFDFYSQMTFLSPRGQRKTLSTPYLPPISSSQ